MRVLVACEYSGRVREAFRALGHEAYSCDLLPSADTSPYHYVGDVRKLLDGWMPVRFTAECDPDGDGWCNAFGVDPCECNCVGPTQDGMEYTEIDGELFGRPNDSPAWDLMIAHPPCTYLTCSAEWAYKEPSEIKNKKLSPDKLYGAARIAAREEAIDFFMVLANAPIERVAIENPIGVISSRFRKPEQIIQPWQFGDDASKSTCLWLKNLPTLQHTNLFPGRMVEWPKGSGKIVERWANQTDSGQSTLSPNPDRWKTRSYTYQGLADAMAAQWGGLVI